MNTPTDIRDALRQMPIFAEFSGGELDALLALVEPMTVPENVVLVKQDELGDCMYIIVDGAVRVVHRAGGREFHLATLTIGDFFGEIALVDQGPRSADVITMEPCVVLALEQSVIRALAGVYPAAAFKILIAVGRVLIQRMRQGNKKYIDSLLIAARSDD
jgi:CRP-like cAMP-binding protein